MLLHEFPNLSWLKEKINQRFDDRVGWSGRTLESKGWPTVLLNVKAKEAFRDQIKGPLSIFTNLSGSSFAGTPNSRARVTADTFYVTNTDQLYTLEIMEPVETFNIHVGEKLSEDLFYSRTRTSAELLDNPERLTNQPPGFYNKLYWKDSRFKQLVNQLSGALAKMEEEELLANLVDYLLDQTYSFKHQEQSLDALKASTREEISRRVFKATDYIYSYYHTDISLEDLAQVSCLSKFHFLRLFKSIFRETPHQFITNLRIEKAKDYLTENSLTVKEVADKVGFMDASSFSRAFRSKVGLYPIRFTA